MALGFYQPLSTRDAPKPINQINAPLTNSGGVLLYPFIVRPGRGGLMTKKLIKCYLRKERVASDEEKKGIADRRELSFHCSIRGSGISFINR